MGKLMTNNYENPLQQALFKAAKVGHIKLMKELIQAGADPYARDEINSNALDYAYRQNPEELKEFLEWLDTN
jgi:ankyrin repeat protein